MDRLRNMDHFYTKAETEALLDVSEAQTDTKFQKALTHFETRFEQILHAITKQSAELKAEFKADQVALKEEFKADHMSLKEAYMTLSQRLTRIEAIISFNGWFIPVIISLIIGISSVIVAHYWH